MIFVVASSWKCASIIARREGLTHSQWTAWTPERPAGDKIQSMENPQIWISNCGVDVLSDADKDVIISRRSHLAKVVCGG